MNKDVHEIVSAGLEAHLARLWRYALVLSGSRDTAEELVQAACVRALERSGQFRPGSRLDRWLFTILNSIWKNELRARKIRAGAGFVDAEQVLTSGGAEEAETNILAREVLTQVQALPEVQRATVFLVYAEGLTYREAAEALDVPVGTIMSRLAAARAKLGRLNDEDASGEKQTGRRG